MASLKKIISNRRNSKKSTGPVSKEGKLKSSQNAIIHGLHSSKFVVIGERIEDLNLIRDKHIKELKPIGVDQELIVSKMIDISIRLKRIPIIEAGIFNHEMLEYEAMEYKDKIASKIEGSNEKGVVVSSDTIVRKIGLSFARDCGSGNAILKLNTIEDRLLSKYFKLLSILKDLQKKKGGKND